MRFGRFILAIAKPLFFLLFPYRVIGREHIPAAGMPLILCSNHISNIDPIFLLAAQKRPVFFMAKSELFSFKPLGWAISRLFGAFPVNRGKGDTGAIDTSVRIVKEGKLLGIFPEGTRSKDGKLGRAKSGAALIASQCGAHVLPVSITTRNQKVKLFRKTVITFGSPISPEALHLNAEHPDLRYASRKIMESIGGLMES